MKTTIQIKADILELILDEVKDMRKKDDSLSDTIEFTIIEQTDTHLGSDRFSAELKSGYSECYGKGIILK